MQDQIIASHTCFRGHIDRNDGQLTPDDRDAKTRTTGQLLF